MTFFNDYFSARKNNYFDYQGNQPSYQGAQSHPYPAAPQAVEYDPYSPNQQLPGTGMPNPQNTDVYEQEPSFGTMLGSMQGSKYSSTGMSGMNAQAPQASMQNIMAMARRTGQDPYQDFINTQNNPYVNSLTGR